MQQTSANLRGDIADVLMETGRNAGQFIGLKGMPLWDVRRDKGVFAKIDANNMIAKVVAQVARGANFPRSQRQTVDESYTTKKYGGEEPIPIEDEAALSYYFDAEVDAAQALLADAKLGLETDQAGVLFDDTTNFASYKTNGTDWTSATDGKPIDDVRKVVTKLEDQVKGFTGGSKTVVLINKTLVNFAAATAQVRAALDYGGNGFENRKVILTKLAGAWGVDEVHESVIRGADGNYLWGATKLGVYLVSEGQDLRSQIQCARTPNWITPQVRQMDNAVPMEEMEGMIVETYDEVQTDSHIVRVKRYNDTKLLSARGGHILYGLDA